MIGLLIERASHILEESPFVALFVIFLLGMLVRTPGLNFINVFRTAFTLADPESAKKTDGFTVFFVLLGSASVKAVHRTLMKLTLNFTYILQEALGPISF